MKSLNTIKYITESTMALNKWESYIDEAKTWDEAKKAGNSAIGYIDAMITFMNCMIHEENNDLTEQLDDVIEEWLYDLYQKMADKALECDEPSEVVVKILEKRNEHKAEA